jgi:transcriptional regulator of acetoin/glycerol metabolism
VSSSTEIGRVRILLLGPEGAARDALAGCLASAGYAVESVVGKRAGNGAYDFVILPWHAEQGWAGSLKAVEHRHLELTLEAMGWNITRAARALGVDRATVYNMMRRFRLHRPDRA